MNSSLEAAIKLFNQEQFHEAHDCLEEFWRNYQGNDRRHYQALIQFCVALYLHRESRLVGARKVLDRAVKNMEGFEGSLDGLDLIRLQDQVLAYFANSAALPKI